MRPIGLDDGVVLDPRPDATPQTPLPSSEIGTHNGCGGVFDRWPVSLHHIAIRCNNCAQGVVLSNKIRTYGDLLLRRPQERLQDLATGRRMLVE